MNLSGLMKQYFPASDNDVTIDVFDEKNIYDVYQRVVSVLTQYIDIETLSMSLDQLKAHTTFRGLNPIASESILTALQRRHLTMIG